MDMLNSTNSGTIQKRDFKKALINFNEENEAELDVDSIVNDVFKNKPNLDRSVASMDRSFIREEMNQNPDIQDSFVAELTQDQIMRQLESIPSGSITLKDLNKALVSVQKENGIQMTPSKVSTLVKSIFNSADDS